jgi:hypothetical protein
MVAVDAQTACSECTSVRHPLFSFTVKYVVTVTSHTVWRHDANVTQGGGGYYRIKLRVTWQAYVLVIRGILAINR